MPFTNENILNNIPLKGAYQTGVSNVDPAPIIEQGIQIPLASNPAASWVYYDCTVGHMLDSGLVVHQRLPQVNRAFDTLASCYLDGQNIDLAVGGVNLKCNDQYADIVQRMGHSRYWFRIWGQALRIGYQVPIPGIKTIGGVPAIPYDKNPQWAFNRIAPGGNYSGAILWHAAWSLWYTTAVPPNSNMFPAADPSAHITGSAPLPQGMQAPFSQPDDEAVPSAPAGGNPVTGVGVTL
jgi:hypothetical protein